MKKKKKKKGRRGAGYNASDSPRARLVYRFISASCKRYSAFDSSPQPSSPLRLGMRVFLSWFITRYICSLFLFFIFFPYFYWI